MKQSEKWDEFYKTARLNWYPQLNVVRFFCGLKNQGDFLKEHGLSLAYHPFLQILDFGCGNGRHTRFLVNEGYDRVFACDFSSLAVHLTEAFVPEAKVTFVEYKIPYISKMFDIVMAEGVFDHMNSKDREYYFREVKRILKPDGIFFLSLIKGDGREEVLKSGLEKGITQKYFTQENILDELRDFNIISIELTTRHLTYPQHNVIIDRYSVFAKVLET